MMQRYSVDKAPDPLPGKPTTFPGADGLRRPPAGPIATTTYFDKYTNVAIFENQVEELMTKVDTYLDMRLNDPEEDVA